MEGFDTLLTPRKLDTFSTTKKNEEEKKSRPPFHPLAWVCRPPARLPSTHGSHDSTRAARMSPPARLACLAFSLGSLEFPRFPRTLDSALHMILLRRRCIQKRWCRRCVWAWSPMARVSSYIESSGGHPLSLRLPRNAATGGATWRRHPHRPALPLRPL
jgi:hypothetical protein